MVKSDDEGHTRYTGVEWNRLADLADGVGKGIGPSVFMEPMRRVVAALDRSERSATALGKRIKTLNVWLLVVTIAIGAMTVVQALAAFRSLMR